MPDSIHEINKNSKLESFWDMKLDSNESYFGPSTKVMQLCKNISFDEILRYPNYESLYEVLSSFYSLPNTSFRLISSTDEAIISIFNATIDVGDEILLFDSYYNFPIKYANVLGIKINVIDSFPHNFSDFSDKINEKTKLVLFSSPNNPLGNLFSKHLLKKLLESFPDVIFVVDEIYAAFAEITYTDLVNNFNNLYVIKSLSVDYALAGLRIGFICSDTYNINHVSKYLSGNNVNNIAVLSAIESIKDKDYLASVVKETELSREFLTSELTSMGFDVYPSVSNFILVDFKSMVDSIYKKFLDCNILVKKIDGKYNGCLRITIPTMSGSKKLIGHIKTKDTIVFDLDGVLIDSTEASIRSAINTFKYFTGKELSIAEFIKLQNEKHISNYFMFTQYLISTYGFNFPEKNIAKVYSRFYWDNGAGLINNEKLIIDIQLLKSLTLKYNVVLFTERSFDETMYILDKFNINRFFSKIVSADDVPIERHKPHTTGLHMIKEYFYTDRIIYFGDSIDDMTCAFNFGAYPIGVIPPCVFDDEHKRLLCEYGAKAVIDNINNLQGILNDITA